jgi:P4 family phage/plasmid primase-like protien
MTNHELIEASDTLLLPSQAESDPFNVETAYDAILDGFEIHDAATDYVMSGLSVIPIRTDGTKAPALREWKTFQQRQPTLDELEEWFVGDYNGIAIVCGAISNNLEVMDFDEDAENVFLRWSEMVASIQPDLLGRLPVIVTPSGGRHVYYRCPVIEGNLKLGRRAVTVAEGTEGARLIDGKWANVRTLIETRGEGGYVVAPPSPAKCHKLNRPYELVRGHLESITIISKEERDILLECARSLNDYVKDEHVFQPKLDREFTSEIGTRPGDEYNARADWHELLTAHGWTQAWSSAGVSHWQRPGKSGKGISATVNYGGSNKLYVFSSNASPFEFERSYDLFSAYTLLEHGGNFNAAARALAAKGYGKPTEGRADQPRTYLMTGVGNAERLIATHGKSLRYCNDWKKWLVWDGQRWGIDSIEEVKRLAKDTLRKLIAEANQLADLEARKALLKWAMRSESEFGIREMVNLAISEPGVAVMTESLDANPMLLNVENGTVDLYTGQLTSHNRADLITKLAPVAYDLNATCPLFLRFMDRIMDGNQELIGFIQRAIGYSLTGRTDEQVLLICHGSGANGKSTLFDLLLYIIGDYGSQTATQTLMVRRNDSIPNDIARLKGARLVTAVESDEGQRLSEALIKQLTGGDRVAARFMRAEWFEFIPTFKLWLATNHKPTIRGGDHSIWRRIRLVPFNVTIPDAEQDKGLAKKLREEASGILRWAVEGCLDWQREGLGLPDVVKAATEGYRSEMDTVTQWISECCVEAKNAKATAADLYDSYRNWCVTSNENAVHKTPFGQKLRERGYEPKKSDSQRLWQGIGLLASSR